MRRNEEKWGEMGVWMKGNGADGGSVREGDNIVSNRQPVTTHTITAMMATTPRHVWEMTCSHDDGRVEDDEE